MKGNTFSHKIGKALSKPQGHLANSRQLELDIIDEYLCESDMLLNNDGSNKSFSSNSCSLNSDNDEDESPQNQKKSKQTTAQFGPKTMHSQERIILSGVIQKYSFKDEVSSKKRGSSFADKKEPEEEQINETISPKDNIINNLDFSAASFENDIDATNQEKDLHGSDVKPLFLSGGSPDSKYGLHINTYSTVKQASSNGG